jgi:hypothetical protein
MECSVSIQPGRVVVFHFSRSTCAANHETRCFMSFLFLLVLPRYSLEFGAQVTRPRWNFLK